MSRVQVPVCITRRVVACLWGSGHLRPFANPDFSQLGGDGRSRGVRPACFSLEVVERRSEGQHEPMCRLLHQVCVNLGVGVFVLGVVRAVGIPDTAHLYISYLGLSPYTGCDLVSDKPPSGASGLVPSLATWASLGQPQHDSGDYLLHLCRREGGVPLPNV